MTGRFACPKAAEAKVVRPGAGRCRACGSRSHFGRRCCLTAGATTDHSPNLAFVRRHSARPETAVQLQYLQNHVQNCSAAVLPRIQWPLPFLKHWIRGLPIFFNPLCGPKPKIYLNKKGTRCRTRTRASTSWCCRRTPRRRLRRSASCSRRAARKASISRERHVHTEGFNLTGSDAARCPLGY